MSCRRCALLCGALLLLFGHARSVAAHAVLEVQSADAAGEGFEDPTPVAPVGGNRGTTRGEQRMIAVQHAADLWGEVLDSDVPIVIEATFDAIGCVGATSTTLAYASTLGIESGIDRDGAHPDWLYPAALADRLMGANLRPGEPDIVAVFNSSVDANCVPGLRWYYGLDARHGQAADLVNVALHELGHGLGVTNLVDSTTGELIGGAPNPFTARVFDNVLGKHWHEMTDTERLGSQLNARHVVWDGPQVSAEAPSVLMAGTPIVGTTPAVAGLSGLAGDANFGAPTLAMSVSAPLIATADGCPFNGVSGRIALLRDSCAHSGWAAAVAELGAIGVVLSMPADWVTPPPSFEEAAGESVQIPVLSVSAADADLLEQAAAQGAVSIHLSYDGDSLRGADAEGRVLLHASSPPNSSTISHWDTLARPNLLMEPLETPHTAHQVDLTRALLIDMGWTPFCGNGRIDQDEPCDDGSDNDDRAPNACRTTCELAGCGDGVLDDGEACDDGEDNDDREPNACRTSCERAHCGDGVVDDGEPCDQGERNSDRAPDACRITCVVPDCGDGVVDRGEECDTGASRNDSEPDACRSDCVAAGCGDGVVDAGEGCDDGVGNDDERPGACRRDCMPARCGDGAVDDGESCDDGEDNSDSAPDACRAGCERARCGDGVRDSGEACDPGDDPDCTADCSEVRRIPIGAGAAGGGGGDGSEPTEAEAKADDDGCGCRVPGGPARRARAAAAFWCALGVLLWRRRRHTRRAPRPLSSAARSPATREQEQGREQQRSAAGEPAGSA